MMDPEKIKRLNYLAALIKKKPLEKSDYQFPNPPLHESDFTDQFIDDKNFPDSRGLDLSL